MTDHLGRDDKDFAIEFGEYLATSVDDFLAALNHRDAAQRLSDFGAEQSADEALTDHWRALQSAVYEFRKRAARAGHDPSAVKLNR